MPNDFAGQAQAPTNDGSLTDAALNMPDLGPGLEEIEQQPARQPRDPSTQQWRSPDETGRNAKSPKEAVEAEGDDEPADEVSTPDEEWFELAAEKEGEAPVRMKAMEVWQEAQEAKRLRTEMDDLRRNSIPPEQWDQSILQVAQARGNLMRQLQMQRAMLQPEQPNQDLLNPESPRYNPEQYYRQMTVAQHQQQRLSQIEQHYSTLEQEQQQQMEALTSAQKQREQAKLHSFWPELRDQKEAAKVRDDLVRHYGKYGMSNELINSVSNSTFYALAKDALAYQRSLKARETAVRVVRAKPKLVKATARDTTSPNNRRAAAGMSRLQQSGSLEDATAALDGLI